MLFKRLPDPHDRRALDGFLWADETVVVHDRAECVAYGRHIAPLTLKTTLKGAERYNVHGFFEDVAPGEYLAVNDAQPYESAIDAAAPVESLCLFFADAEVAAARRAGLADEVTLDDPETFLATAELPAVKRSAGPRLTALLTATPRMRGEPALRRHAHSMRVLVALLRQERALAPRDVSGAIRAATRAELRRRCEIGRAYIEAMYAEDIALADVARIAGLSRTHFLRAFSGCYGETPYQALRRRRLEEALSLLQRGADSVSAIAVSVGYEDFSAFSRAFRRQYGFAPSAGRR